MTGTAVPLIIENDEKAVGIHQFSLWKFREIVDGDSAWEDFGLSRTTAFLKSIRRTS